MIITRNRKTTQCLLCKKSCLLNKAAKYLWKRRKPTHSPYREQEFLHWPNGQPPLLPGSVVRCNDPYMYKTYQEISDHCNQAVLKYLEEDKEK